MTDQADDQSATSLETLFEQTRAEAGFVVMLMTDAQGQIIAAARADDAPPETVGAMLDVAGRIASRPEDRTRLLDMGESTFFDWDGNQVICRLILVGKPPQPRLLVVMAPPGVAYKRAVNQLVKEARRLLKA